MHNPASHRPATSPLSTVEFHRPTPTRLEERQGLGRRGPSEEGELDEIQQEFEALTRWRRDAEQAQELARQTSLQLEEGQAQERAVVGAGDWRGVLGTQQRHPRIESDVSVDVMSMSTYAQQLQFQQRAQIASARPSLAGSPVSRPTCTTRLTSSRDSVYTPKSPAPSYTSRFPPTSAAPSFRYSESYANPRPNDDYSLPPVRTSPPHDAFTPGLFDAQVGHHTNLEYEEDGQVSRRALKSFPKWSREWFATRDDGYEGIGQELWEGGLTGDLADGMDPTKRLPTSEALKNARIKRLEKEFGPEQRGAPEDSSHQAQRMDGPLRVGDLDKRGQIFSSGPRKRSCLRWFECLLSLVVIVVLVYSALFLKDLVPSPPPQSSIPAYVLYVWSIIGFMGTIVLFLVYPFFIRPRRLKQLGQHTHPSGGMILPMAHPRGNKKSKRNGQPMNINLVVDPRFFAPTALPKSSRRRSSSSSSSSFSDRAALNPRSSFSDVLTQRERFSFARKWLLKVLWFDLLFALGWAASFGLAVVLGGTCPPGSSQGWCDCWNTALAGSVLVSLCFFTSAFFGFRDRKIQLRLHT